MEQEVLLTESVEMQGSTKRIRYELIKYRRPHPLYLLQKVVGCCGIDDFTDLWLLEWYYWQYFHYEYAKGNTQFPNNYTGPMKGNGPKDEGLFEDEKAVELYPRDEVLATMTLQPDMPFRLARLVTRSMSDSKRGTAKVQSPYWQAYHGIANKTDEDLSEYIEEEEDEEDEDEERGQKIEDELSEVEKDENDNSEIEAKKGKKREADLDRKTKRAKIIRRNVSGKKRKRNNVIRLKLPLLKKKPKSEKELLKLLNYLDGVISDYAARKAERFFTKNWIREDLNDYGEYSMIPNFNASTWPKLADNNFLTSMPGWFQWSFGSEIYFAHLYWWQWYFDSELTFYPTELPSKSITSPVQWTFELVQTCCKNPSMNCSRNYRKGKFHDDGCGRKLVADWRLAASELGGMLILFSFTLSAILVMNLLYFAGVQEYLYF